MPDQVSTVRLYGLRFVYLLTAVMVGIGSWPEVMRRSSAAEDFMGGIAFSIYAAYSLLMLLGVLIPLRMLPLVLLQLIYKSIWVAGIGFPLWRNGHGDMVSKTVELFAMIVVLDLVAIPWQHVYRHYVRAIWDQVQRGSRPRTT